MARCDCRRTKLHKMFDLILDLPQVLLSDLLVNWLEVKYVGRYDAALCVRSRRAELVALYDTLEHVKHLITTPQKSNEVHLNLIKWAVIRKIKITKAVFQHDIYWTEQSDVMREFFHQNGQRLKSIKIENCDCAMSNTMKLVTTKCLNLETLAVIRCTLTMEIPKMLLRKDIEIRELHLESKPLSERKIGKSYFGKVRCATIERLHLVGFIEEGCLVNVAKAFPNLQDVHFRIRFDSPNKSSHKNLQTIWPTGKRCWKDFIAACNPNLRAISLDRCGSVTQATWEAMLAAFPSLTTITIKRCYILQPDALMALSAAPCASSLRSLTISHLTCDQAAMQSVINCCHALSTLHIYNSPVFQATFIHILQGAHNLRELDLREVWGTEKPFKLVADYGQCLEVFAHGYYYYDSRPNRATSHTADIVALVKQCPNLRVLKIAHDHVAAKEAGRPGFKVELPATYPVD